MSAQGTAGEWVLRPGASADLPAVLALNEAEVPAVSPLTADSLGALCDEAQGLTVAARDRQIGGFLLSFVAGAAYASTNYLWFCARYSRFCYVDRIVVAPATQRAGIGQHLYAALEAQARAAGHDILCAEVNLRPRNVQSLRFHARYGFVEVGQQDTDGGAKRVSMLAKPLVSSPR